MQTGMEKYVLENHPVSLPTMPISSEPSVTKDNVGNGLSKPSNNELWKSMFLIQQII